MCVSACGGVSKRVSQRRVGRGHGTNQDRLVKKLRQGVTTYAAANAYLETTYWAAHNARLAVAPAEGADFHMPLDHHGQLADVFCMEEQRAAAQAATPPPPVRPPRLTPPAGYTRAGQPLSAKQMAVRERWNQAARDHIQRTARRAPAPRVPD